jgi:hypothetical protein
VAENINDAEVVEIDAADGDLLIVSDSGVPTEKVFKRVPVGTIVTAVEKANSAVQPEALGPLADLTAPELTDLIDAQITARDDELAALIAALMA